MLNRVVFLLALVMILGTGCATHKVKDVPVKKLSDYSCYTCDNDIEVAIDVYAETEKTKQAFYADLNSKQFYPIHILLKNNTNGRLFVLRDGIVLNDPVGTEFKHTRSAAMYEDFEHNKMAYALLGFGIFSYMSAEDANNKMKADWSEKEFPDEMIINSGRVNSGFAYLKLPEGVRPEGKTLSIDVEDMESHERRTVVVQL
ncbi:hypothetical protein [Desulfovibrio ferrophilus]|uniref:Uncharacterized protein n=1 Tax=Desulfovibrio ferrophilus TaxID=241368 RepID=A0A2Z6AVE3_9BACT|nr:hypothetical protein [Desulfovibrio ferrophilus]BBD07193.1 uncharacterized protein DFE_0467 [Desulfovibrio ferrophilus]